MPPLQPLSTECYETLRRVAAQMFITEGPCTLQPTALVHEALLRIHGNTSSDSRMKDKRYFFASAAEAMRRILIEKARKRNTEKHGNCFIRIPLDQVNVENESTVELDDLDHALEILERQDKEAAELVRLRFYVGMTMGQVSEVMDISLRSAERLWTYSKTWLYEKLTHSNRIDGG